MRLEVSREIPEDSALREQWNALVRALESPEVFYTYEWALAVWRAYGRELLPLLFLGYENDSLVGILALAEQNRGEVSFLCATTGDYCDFLTLPGHRDPFLAAVLADLSTRGVRRITLTNLPADSGTYEAIRRLGRHSGYHCFARTAYICTQVVIGKIGRQPGTGELLLAGKERVRRFVKATRGKGSVRLDHARTSEKIESLLPEFVRAHVARFLATGRISNLVSPERRRFLEQLSFLLSQSGWVTLSRVVAGEKNVAWHYGFQFQGIWFWYQPTFDNELEKYSPGYYLLTRMIEEAAQDPATERLDLGLGAEEYKDRFANESRRTLYVTLRSSVAQHAYEIMRFRAAQVMKSVPVLENAVRAGAARIERLKQEMARDGMGSTLRRIVTRVREFFWLEEEVFFLNWGTATSVCSSAARVERLSFTDLATAALQCHDDQETLEYLMRSASRMRKGGAECFGLIDRMGRFVHFAWRCPFEGFYLAELHARVDAPSPDSVMLFDCWTPPGARRNGYYRETVTATAEQVRKQGKDPWIFSAARNLASLRGLEKAGFERRYVLVRQRVLIWQRIKGKTPQLAPPVLEQAETPSESRAS